MNEYKFLPTLMWKYNYEPGFDTTEFSKSLDRIGVKGNYEADGGLTTAGMGENIHEWPSLVPFLNWLRPKIEVALNEWQVNWKQYFITKSWVNSHPKGGYTRTHDHGSTHVVVSIYISNLKMVAMLNLKTLCVVNGYHICEETSQAICMTIIVKYL